MKKDELKVSPVDVFLDNAVFYAGSIRPYVEKAMAMVESSFMSIAEIDMRLEQINKSLARYQGKQDGKIMVHFVDKESYPRPVLVVYKRYERKVNGKSFAVSRLKWSGRNASSQRNTISLNGEKLDNDKCVKLLIDAAAGLIEKRAEEMKKVVGAHKSLGFLAQRVQTALKEFDESVKRAKSLVETDFYDMESAFESISERKKEKERVWAMRDAERRLRKNGH